ncbi:hypothetical protein BDF20DRAFT_904186 [Mycotypha africana]|uniref:uncharacterized protein n=1 Tax=Mycotypha africana TaxID=64632 RepID=UPI0023017DD1|nr:uncharacterized protein BDF20DRAFT_904186 [Mycotypha africana]KAI8991639.1 hypothetical protein BDF20DRAFT_904186 [Mycotypha africana]
MTLSDRLPWDSDKPLSLSQLLKQSMKAVDTIVSDPSVLDKMATHLNGLLRETEQESTRQIDQALDLFDKLFLNAEKAMSSNADKHVVSVLRQQMCSFIGITLGVKEFLDHQQEQQQAPNVEMNSDDEDEGVKKLSLNAAYESHQNRAWGENKSYYEQNNVDIYAAEKAEHEKLKQQLEEDERYYERKLAAEEEEEEEEEEEDDDDEGDNDNEEDEYEDEEVVVDEVQISSREIGSREIVSRGLGDDDGFKVVTHRQKKKKKGTVISTNFTYSNYRNRNDRDDNSRRPPPRHRIRVREFCPDYLERLPSETFCIPVFFPSEESYALFQSALSTAKETLYICVYSMTDNDTADILVDAKKRGVDVRVITDNDQMDVAKGSDVVRLNEQFNIPFKHDNSEQFMHNKFAVIDNKTIITGSFNWSIGARYRNRENIVVTNIPSVVRAFADEFHRLWQIY